MNAFQTLALILTIVAVFAYVNHRWVRLPATIGLMAMSLGAAVILIWVDRLGLLAVSAPARVILERIDFDDTVLHGMLGVLLFAGALHVDLNDLRQHVTSIAVLAICGTVASAFIVAGVAYAILPVCGVALPWSHCLLFGALISPTDPIAVGGILKRVGVPKAIEIQITGESLFNDGVGVVLFLTVLGAIRSGDASVSDVALLFAREALGGAAFGLVSGYAAFRLLRSIDHYQTELLLTLALVLGGYALAERLHVSAPVAAVAAGLLIGNQGRSLGMSDVTRDHLDKFWSLVDEVLNAVLVVLVGFEVIAFSVRGQAVLAGLLMVPTVLFARLASVGAPVAALRRWGHFVSGATTVLTWGGLRGGISLALAMSVGASSDHDIIVGMTYIVVVFSILVQGLTLGRVVTFVMTPRPRRKGAPAPRAPAA